MTALQAPRTRASLGAIRSGRLLFFELSGGCIHSMTSCRTYSPETVGLRSAAFDRVYQSVSSRLMNEHEDLKQSLALIILRHVDRGERDPEQLADVALREWSGIERWEEARDRSATG